MTKLWSAALRLHILLRFVAVHCKKTAGSSGLCKETGMFVFGVNHYSLNIHFWYKTFRPFLGAPVAVV